MEPSGFHALEHAGWEAAVAAYDEAFARLTSQSLGPLMEALQAGPGTRLLDVACGPGYLCDRAGAAQTVGIDFSLAMVALARRRHPQARFAVGDAHRLPVADERFDAVAMNFGLLHLAQPGQALAEAARVLVPGGRFGFTVWAAPPATAAYRIVLDAIGRYGRLDAPLPPGPPFFRFSDPGEAIGALEAAGLARATVSTVPQTWRLSRAGDLFDAMLHGTVRTGALLRAQSPAALAAIRAEVTAQAGAYATAEGIALPMPSMLAVARKPL